MHSAQVDSLGTLNYLTGKRVHLQRHAQLCLEYRLWFRTFSNCISILNYEAHTTPRRGEECTTCDATRLKWPVYASVSSQETGSVRPAGVDLPSCRPVLQPISGRAERFLCQEAQHRKPLGRMCMVILQECTESVPPLCLTSNINLSASL